MTAKFTPPSDVISPKQHWNLIAVLDEGKADNCALALGRWDGQLVLAMRWNGNENNPVGNPQSRGLPTWFVVPQKYNEALIRLGGLPADKVTLVRGFFPDNLEDAV